MSDVQQFRLPDVGEGLTEAEILEWKVSVGDTVKVNDVVVEIETAKSAVELPVPFAGVVTELLVAEGETVPVGTPIISVRTGGAASAGPAAAAVAAPAPAAAAAPASGASLGEGRQAVLVGYGPRLTSAARRPRKAHTGPDPAAAAAVNEAFSTDAPVSVPVGDLAESPGDVRVLAKPPVRKLAKGLGIDLRTVRPSGAGGVITRADVEGAATRSGARPPAPVSVPAWGAGRLEERVPIRSVRKATAAAVTLSAFTAPHVTEFVTVDVTRSVRLVERLRDSRDFRGVRLSPLAVLARAVCLAVRRTPDVNSSWDEATQEIVYKRYVDLGIAAATPRGLVVPKVRDADGLDLRGLAEAINVLAETARSGRTPPSDMTGGTISITNVGVFGVDTGTPILPPGEAAIVCFGAIRRQPWVHKGSIRARHVTTLALSFDHRLVDGAQGSRFLADVAAMLVDPAQALVWA